MEYTPILALFLVLLTMTAGDVVSKKTKALIPSVFVAAFIFLVGFWTIFPKDLISFAGLGQPLAGVIIYLLIVHLGTLMNVRELIQQWKTVLISIAGIIGIMASLLTVGSLVIGRDAAIVGTPPLTGGVVASFLMRDAAEAAGKVDLAVLAILVYVVQGFVGYPLTAYFLKKEARRLLNNPNGPAPAVQAVSAPSQERKTLIKFPEKYNTSYMILFRLALVAVLADVFTQFLNHSILHQPKMVSPYVTCLIFGVIAAEIGLVDRKPLDKSASIGWFLFHLMAFIFEGLNAATPALILQVSGKLAGVVVIGVTGLIILAWLAGRFLKESTYMSLCIALNCLYGFPPNVILTNEAIAASTDKEEEAAYLTEVMMPKMLIGGFTSVTIVSVIVGGIFASLL